jgi:hypothetical protein
MKSMVNIFWLGATLQIWLVCIVTALATTGTQLPPSHKSDESSASDRRATAATGAATGAAVAAAVVPTVRLNNGVELPTMLCVATR